MRENKEIQMESTKKLFAGFFMMLMVASCLILIHPLEAACAETNYDNTYYCMNKMLGLIGEGNYICVEDKENKELSIQLLADVEISDSCSFDGSDDWSDLQADWIPLNEMEITFDFNGHYMDFTGSGGLNILYGANVIFTNSGGIKTSQDITSLITIWGSTLKIEKSAAPAAGEEQKTPGVPSFMNTNTEKVNNVIQISRYFDDDGNCVYSDVEIEDAYISSENGIGINFMGGNLDIWNATITAKRAAIENQSLTSDNTICIYDGVYTATDTDPVFYSAAIVVMCSTFEGEDKPVYGYTYIYGGTYSGYDAVYASTGKVYVSGECSFDGSNRAGFVIFDGTLVFADNQSTITGGPAGAIYGGNSDILIAGGNYSATGESVICGTTSDIMIQAGNFSCTEGQSLIELEGGSLNYKQGMINGVEISENEIDTIDGVVLKEGATLVHTGNTDGEYHITYMNAEGICGNEFNPVTVNAGETYPLHKLYMPGFFFGGWYTDEACTQEITELVNVTSDLTLYPLFLDRDKNQKEFTNISYKSNIQADCRDLEPFDAGVTVLSGNTTADISYTSSDDSIAVITEDGKIQLTGKVGDVMISGYIPGTELYFAKYFDIVLSVQKHMAVITYTNPGQVLTTQQGMFSLNATVTQTNGAVAGKLIYSSSDPETVSVDDAGNLKAYQEGGAVITISMEETDDCRADNIRFFVGSKIAKHEVCFYGNGGKTDKEVDYLKEGDCFGKMPEATREGYIFDGWYTAQNGGSKITSDTIVPATNAMSQYLYAHWILQEYHLLYQLNGGENSAKNPEIYTVETDTVTLDSPIRKGYTFAGWYDDALFQNPVTTIEKGSVGDKTLYAKWDANSYSITYKLNNGKNDKKNPTSFTISTETITLKPASRKGYTFVGWYSDKSYKNKVTKIKKGSVENITLYAKWKKNSYKITYKLNKGKNHKKNPTSYTITTKTITLKSASRKGYKFMGWYSDKKFKHKVTKIKKGSTGKITLYAKWKKNC